MENMEMTYEQRHAREYEKVSLREQICYGLGDSACNVVYGLCSTLLTFFYTDYVGGKSSDSRYGIPDYKSVRRNIRFDYGIHYRPDKIQMGKSKTVDFVDVCTLCSHICAVVPDTGECK